MKARLIAFAPREVLTYPLLEGRTVTIGRAPAADLRISDASISRVHACVRYDGAQGGLRVRDLRSRNGTKLRGERLEPDRDYEFEPEEIVEIGDAQIVVHLEPILGELRRLWPHGHFEVRLDDECARAARTGETFSVLRLRVRGEAQPRAVEETLSTFVGPRDLIGLYAPGEYEMLLTDSSASPEQVEQVVSGIRLGLSRLGAAIDVGAARYGRDGHTAEALIARAEEGSSSRPSKPGEIIVVSAAMRALFKLVDRVAASGVNVLVCGEPGSGKQVVAEAIHRRSRRAAGPFVQLNCATLEAEALSGLASRVAGGTAFADDVGELPPRMQVALLRALSDPGWSGRVISATHRDLTQAAAHGLFHPDLLKLLEGISLTVPPLRARRDEIPLMAARFADPVPFTAEALALLGAYDWPGNVRELQNVVERAVRLAGAGPIDRAHLPVDKLSAAMILTPSIVHVLPISPSAERFDSGLERFDTLEPMGGSVPIDADGDAPRDGDED